MFDAQTTALLRAVLDDVRQTVSRYETGTRTHVAAKILEAARGETTPNGLMQVGRKALRDAPTTWGWTGPAAELGKHQGQVVTVHGRSRRTASG
jgi:hypothetical protein